MNIYDFILKREEAAEKMCACFMMRIKKLVVKKMGEYVKKNGFTLVEV